MEGKEKTRKRVRTLAIIDETNCIGCTKCVKICPVNAIIGTTYMIHTVMEDFCTGCGLCVAPCPSRCISLRLDVNVPDNREKNEK